MPSRRSCVNRTVALASALLALAGRAATAQSPRAAIAALPISHRDRVYTADQFSNTISVIDPADNRALGVIRLGDPLPRSLSPLYRGQLLVHGLGFSPDHRTLVVVSVGSNSVAFIDTPSNAVKHVAYVGRSPHEAFFTPNGKEVWVTVRGEDYVSVLDATTYRETTRIKVPDGPGMQIFSPDGKYGYVCASFTALTVVISVADHRVVGRVPQASPFCPNIAVSPDGTQVWFTLKDVGRTTVFDARPPFRVLRTLETGPITNHVAVVRNRLGMWAYVTVGGRNAVQVYRTDTFARVGSIPVGHLPHGIWASGDGTRVYVGLENDDRVVVIDALSNTVLASIPVGQAPQALVYVPNAVPSGTGTSGLQAPGLAANVEQLTLVSSASATTATRSVTTVALFDQGLVQVVQSAVAGLKPRSAYVLALSSRRDGSGELTPLAEFTTNQAGAAIVNAVAPLRHVVHDASPATQRFLVVVAGTTRSLGETVQVQRH